MSVIPWYYKFIVIVACFMAFIIAINSWNNHEQSIGASIEKLKYEKILAVQKAESEALLASETSKVIDIERKLNEMKNQREVVDNENKKKVDNLSNSVRILTGAVRLRDPNARCGQNNSTSKGATTSNTSNSTGNGTNAGELLSPELNQLLWDRAEKADRINIAFLSCKEDSKNIRAMLDKYNNK